MSQSFFRDQAQAARACRKLLESVGLGHLFTDSGPTPEAAAARDSTPGEAGVLLRAAWALYRGEGGPTLRDLQALSEPVKVELAILMRCIESGPDAVDTWLSGVDPAGFTGPDVAQA